MIFDAFFELLLDLEGGYHHHDLDRGGKTKFGITEKTLENYNKKHNLNYKIFDITKDIAKDIYITEYFNYVMYWEDKQVYYHYFDICVNSGYNRYKKCEIKTNGNLELIVNYRKKFYEDIVKNNESQRVFLKGWLNRLKKIESYFKLKAI